VSIVYHFAKYIVQVPGLVFQLIEASAGLQDALGNIACCRIDVSALTQLQVVFAYAVFCQRVLDGDKLRQAIQ
jgi:hypothetical protein